ncbi:MAG: tol-pal system protein YbgF [Alphaproteobacteria bacterium]|nr:tol-pal system protein YbgF [Alphaproteobacteria bacterium]
MTDFSLNWLRAVASAAAIFAFFPGAVPPVLAQEDVRPLLDRMERLERDITLIQRQLYRSGSPGSTNGESAVSAEPPPISGDTALHLEERVNGFERIMTNMNGQVEEANFQITQLRTRLDKLVADVDFRLKEIESRLGPSAAGSTPSASDSHLPPPAAAGKRPGAEADAVAAFGKTAAEDAGAGNARSGALPEGTPKEQYEHAYSLLGQRDFPGAERAFASFLEAHGDDALAGNAQYWLGETFFVRGDFRQAAVAFAKGYQKYPKSGKAADNVLKLGLSLARLDRVADACMAFGKLGSEFRNASADIKQRAAVERKKFACR